MTFSESFTVPGDAPDAGGASAREFQLGRGEAIFQAGDDGCAWKILRGAVRLDHRSRAEPCCVSLAAAGDIIGIDAALKGQHGYHATALTSCTIIPWHPLRLPGGKDALLQALARSEARMAEMVRLRSGRAQARVHRFLSMLGDTPAELPPLQDIADVTGLSMETVSRTVSTLADEGVIALDGKQRAQRILRVGTLDFAGA